MFVTQAPGKYSPLVLGGTTPGGFAGGGITPGGGDGGITPGGVDGGITPGGGICGAGGGTTPAGGTGGGTTPTGGADGGTTAAGGVDGGDGGTTPADGVAGTTLGGGSTGGAIAAGGGTTLDGGISDDDGLGVSGITTPDDGELFGITPLGGVLLLPGLLPAFVAGCTGIEPPLCRAVDMQAVVQSIANELSANAKTCGLTNIPDRMKGLVYAWSNAVWGLYCKGYA